VLLNVIDKEPEAVRRALKRAAAAGGKAPKAKKTVRKRA
jgi:hypothetical protein